MREQETIDKIKEGNSLARFGTGEILLMHGCNAYHQVFDQKLKEELHHILYNSKVLVGIPHVHGFRPGYWAAFLEEFPIRTNPDKKYYSSFISHPDEATFQDPKPVWSAKNVLLVTGGPDFDFPGAKSISYMSVPSQNAYSQINWIADYIEVAYPDKLVIVCAGPTGTCLAHRLDLKGIRTVDYGNLGKYQSLFV